ncbi:conserved protein of unknown function [Bartonella clarridgeiae 73]|uniref:Polysaccharide chain length determinant N-terminal domain-containing protein n=1 Tax=Bartonella clarridgeiae (strain CCUG 45776 / CIP 104772 / 73) TaxID=696125 RepID=E6YI24_BARC7|nr:membrane protein [Bartonella clarridgeiae]WCR54915.1 MAG: hypothetical protein PG977_000308 [Bartonella clarridgeiae]CBI76512.1 conserved protein of unknown function [Bartonella clarridgeiae 73]
MPRKALTALLLAIHCVLLILLYYFICPKPYQATLTFMLSDSSGIPLSINKQNNIIALLFSQPVIVNYSNSDKAIPYDVYVKDFYKNIQLLRKGDLINLSFEAKTVEDARQGLETWFSNFSEKIIKREKQYDKSTLFHILQTFRSSIASTIHHEAKQAEFNSLYAQLTDTILRRIRLKSLNSTIKMMRQQGQSLLSLSFITNNLAIIALEAKLNLLNTQKAHMAVQLGWEHPQIKAMIAETKELSAQLESKISQIVDQIHSDAIIAESFETQLRGKISTFVEDQSQSLNQILNELEDKIVIEGQNQQINMDAPSLQNIKIHMIAPIEVTPISFMDFYSRNIFVAIFASLIALGGALLLQKYSGVQKVQSEKESFKSNDSISLFKVRRNEETLITIEELLVFLKSRVSTVVSIIGPEAAQMAAKLSLHLIKEQKMILLVDISGQQIEKVIGPRRGLSDVLTGSAQLHDVIYHDYDTGIDILPRGLTSAKCAKKFSNIIPVILEEFKKDYDFIILEMTVEPEYELEKIAESTNYYVCSVPFDKHNWMAKMVYRFPKVVYHVNS